MFYIIIVIYNKRLDDSKTINTLQKEIKNHCVFLCDNSTIEYRNKLTCNNYPSITYIDMGGNQGLSKAYNRAISRIPKERDSFVVLFDDDTDVPHGFLQKMRKEIEAHPEADIFLPLVYDLDGLLSPNIMKNNFNHRAKNVSDIAPDDLCAINSGMVIRSTLYEDYMYNEEQFLDFVDFAFIRDMKRKGVKIHVVEDVKLDQDFSATVYDREKEIRRFKILKKDLKVYYNNSKFYYYYIIMRRKVKLCLKYRTLKFLFV